MFCAFVRGESARRSTGGTGLGLAIAQEIMEKHQGELFYIRETGENIFSIRIPNPIKCESIS
jgi:signal transduction histidine kinase